MEITILLMLFSFSLMLLYLAFSRDYSIRGVTFALSFLAGLGLIATGFYVHTSVLYIGYGSPVNVITYDITGDAVNGFSNPVVGLFFELSGFIVWVIAILIEIYGGSDALKEGGVKQNGR
jgi:hypothetical protein